MARIAGQRLGLRWFLREFYDAISVVDGHHPEGRSALDRHLQASDGDIRMSRRVKREHLAVVHLVDLVAGKDKDVLRRVLANDVDVLEDRVRGALVPGLVHALRSGHQFDEFAELAAQKSPPSLNVAYQTVRFVLRDDADAADA